jgi:hypothetical protein
MKMALHSWTRASPWTWTARVLTLCLVLFYVEKHMLPSWNKVNHAPHAQRLEQAQNYLADARERLPDAKEAAKQVPVDAAAKKNLKRVETQLERWNARIKVYTRNGRGSLGARDYATYHYAVKAAQETGDPYATELDTYEELTPELREKLLEEFGTLRALDQAKSKDLREIEGVSPRLAFDLIKGKLAQPAMSTLAQEEETRKSVHPYFYPPPYLLMMSWALPLSLQESVQVWFWANQLLLLAIGGVLIRWFGAPVLWLAILLATFAPIPNNSTMGQANLPVLFIAILGLWKKRGWLIGMAAMFKMSPALYLFGWAARKWWRRCIGAVVSAVALSVLALTLVDLKAQIRFYTEVLPTFSTGDDHGLVVPIAMGRYRGNHSIPELLNQTWPGPDGHTLSTAASMGSKGIVFLLLAGLCWIARRERDALGEACLGGALTVLMLITPVFTYEHHLVFMILPLAALGTVIVQGRLGKRWWLPSAAAYGCLAMTLPQVEKLWLKFPAWEAWIQECKLISMVAVLLILAYTAHRSPLEGGLEGSDLGEEEDQGDPEQVGEQQVDDLGPDRGEHQQIEEAEEDLGDDQGLQAEAPELDAGATG